MKNTPVTNLPTDRADLIDLIKRVAKREKKLQTVSFPLSKLLDSVAANLGYKNWSLFHHDIVQMPNKKFAVIESKVKSFPEVQALLKYLSIDKAAATEEMQAFVRSNYSRLVNFAYYDSESENGYAAASVDLQEQLADEFSGTYPEELIQTVATEMEEDGPWGVEDYGEN